MDALPFSRLVEINPSVRIEKATEQPFVEMAIVDPGRRYVLTNRTRAYKGGGARFMPGDTLFARITPCLENGKIAQYQGADGQAAFGSTEFFVFRARPGRSDPGYVYYLAKSDLLRKPAEKSMSGASGRQRADLKSIVDLEVPAPPLPTQRKIAAILSAYDDLIENNLRRIKILEEMAQNLYREWFVKFRFPGHEDARFVDSEVGRIPEGWEVVPLEDLVRLRRDSVQPMRFPEESFELFSFPAHDAGRLPVIAEGQTIKSGKYEVPPNCVMVPKLNPHIPRVWLPRPSSNLRSVASTEYLILEPYRYSTAYYYVLFSGPGMAERLTRRADGTSTSHKRLKPKDFMRQPVAAPPDCYADAFDSLVVPAMDLVTVLIRRNRTLRRTRDLLLPKLISGEVDVSELDIAVSEEVKG